METAAFPLSKDAKGEVSYLREGPMMRVRFQSRRRDHTMVQRVCVAAYFAHFRSVIHTSRWQAPKRSGTERETEKCCQAVCNKARQKNYEDKYHNFPFTQA